MSVFSVGPGPGWGGRSQRGLVSHLLSDPASQPALPPLAPGHCRLSPHLGSPQAELRAQVAALTGVWPETSARATEPQLPCLVTSDEG